RSESSSLGPRIATTEPGSYPPPSIQVHRQSAYPPPLLSATLSIWLRPSHQALSSDRAFFLIWRECNPTHDSLSLCDMHGSHADPSHLAQPATPSTRRLSGPAPPSPPPWAPLLATPT